LQKLIAARFAPLSIDWGFGATFLDGGQFKRGCAERIGRSSAWRRRLIRIFLCDDNGRRPAYGGQEVFQSDPYWRDYLQFHEYFHGDNGAELGASHQTGWTALVAKLIQQSGGRPL
jgi:hypothetical protein